MQLSVALITVIESDEVNIDSKNTSFKRLFEKEAIRCFTYWRKNGGNLSNIDIYTVCITKNKISNFTKEKLKSLNVTYVEEYYPETENFDCGFYNKPLGCKHLEEILEHDFLIHVDLDMYLMKEPVFNLQNSCMIYDKKQLSSERIHLDETVIDTFNTCLMLTRRKDKIFSKWWDKLKFIDSHYKKEKEYYDKNYKNLEYRKLEELSFDILSKEISIHNIPNCIFGETYTKLSEMSLEQLNSIYFHHFHIYEYFNQYNWLEDIKQWKVHSN
jgi:hypothetical protein